MGDTAIVVEALQKRFGKVEALRGIDLAVPQGSVLGLLGPNGAGKTTAVRILTTLLRPSAGRASVLGHDVVRDGAAVRRLIGLAGQGTSLVETARSTGAELAQFLQERPGMSTFGLSDGVVYHTYSAYARGLDGLWGAYQWLDRAPLGRNGDDHIWVRHDEYDAVTA